MPKMLFLIVKNAGRHKSENNKEYIWTFIRVSLNLKWKNPKDNQLQITHLLDNWTLLENQYDRREVVSGCGLCQRIIQVLHDKSHPLNT